MTTTPSGAANPTPAQVYSRAYAGKWMVVQPTTDRQPVSADFFHLESVGTHPTGLFVTGKFAGGQSKSMRASAVREANEEEIAALQSANPAGASAE
ncbi:MAG: hypothetical protein ABI992_05980 [Chthoniobacterales bacterium]